ncbi:hypothetical protein BGX28_004256 [Mortierella sp. GBA30]|nr:hypothetical protein BGX28_004256 [Mortierella sp. GBA30]
MESKTSPGSTSSIDMTRPEEVSSSNSVNGNNPKDSVSHSSGSGSQQAQTMYESRGSLDTLAAAALKPLPETYGQHRHSSQQEQQQQHELKEQQHHQSPHPTQARESLGAQKNNGGLSPRQIQDQSLENEGMVSSQTCLDANEAHSARYHYRDQRQQLSDEDSEEDRHHSSPQQGQESYTNQSHRQSPQSQTLKTNTRSTMSISSLLGDSPARGFPRKHMDESPSQAQSHTHSTHSTPEQHTKQPLTSHRSVKMDSEDFIERSTPRSRHMATTKMAMAAQDRRCHHSRISITTTIITLFTTITIVTIIAKALAQ